MRLKMTGIVAAVAAAAAAVTFAAPASASDPGGGGSWDHIYVSQDKGATLYVQEHGDLFMLCDSLADGLSAKADIGWLDGVYGYGFSLKVGNFRSCVTSTAATHDIPEGAGVDVTVYAYAPDKLDHWYFINDH